MTLTREGERLVEHARAITAQLNAARADVEHLGANGTEGVRIGTFQSVSQTLLPEIVRTLTSEDVPITLREDLAMEQQIEMLVTGELDVAFVLMPVDQVAAVEAIELLQDPWVLAVRTDHPLVWQQRPVGARDVSDLPLITFEQLRPQKLIEGSLRAAGAHVRVVTRLRDYASVVAMVAAGLGCGLVPRLAVDADSGAARLAGLRFLEIENQPPRLIGLAWKKERANDAAVRRVVELATAAVASPSYRSPRVTNGRTA